MIAVLRCSAVILVTAITSAHATNIKTVEGLYLTDSYDHGCQTALREHQASVEKGRAILNGHRENPAYGTTDTDAAYLLIEDGAVQDTSATLDGKVLQVQQNDGERALFYLQGTGSVRQIMKISIEQVQGRVWKLGQHMRGPTMETIKPIGPTYTTLCRLD